jgi:ABC-2 type transport system permease protein
MPIFDQGYQHWQGSLSGHTWRWLTVARHGVRAQMKNRWARLLLLFAIFPALILSGAFVLWELFGQQSGLLGPLVRELGLPPGLAQQPQAYRSAFWTLAYGQFFERQIFFSMLLVLLIGPNLISQDLRFNALPLYFSRPLRRPDYFLGKLGVIAFFLSAVMILPAVLAWVLGVAFSLDPGAITASFPLLLAVIGYGLIVVLVTGTLMLALSSLSRNSRYVSALWLGIWFVGSLVAGALTEGIRQPWCRLFSLTGNMQRVGDALLGVQAAWDRLLPAGAMPSGPRHGPPRAIFVPVPDTPWTWSALVLLGLVVLSLWILSSRVKSLDRLK